MIAVTTRLLAVAILLSVSGVTLAQSPAAADQLLSPEQLDALVAPIALYPDPLLAEIFMASTYPLEVVEAERWVQANKNLKGDALKAAVDKQSWDDTVKSLVATPSVLDMMSAQLDWMQALGNAVLAQQPDLMAAVQRLRVKAQANNKLTSNQQQTVTVQHERSAGHSDPADGSRSSLRAVLRSVGGVRGVAVSGLSAILLAGSWLHRRRHYRHRDRLRRRLRARPLGRRGLSLGRRIWLGRQQHLRQPLRQHEPGRQQLDA
jgi:hypothetical protein